MFNVYGTKLVRFINFVAFLGTRVDPPQWNYLEPLQFPHHGREIVNRENLN